MNSAVALLRTSVGQKLLMALTGLGLLLFLVVHLIGNLYLFQGPEPLNAYAAWLKNHPLLWPARIGLLAVFVLHIVGGITLARANRAARPVGYASRGDRSFDTAASRSMWLTGLVVLAFVVFHLAHFTFGAVLPDAHALVDDQGRHDVYGMVTAGFAVPWVVATYVVAMGVLGVHLVHAGTSLIQTLGFHYRYGNRILQGAGLAVVALLVLGNLTLPLSVSLGWAGEASAPTTAQVHTGVSP